MGGTGSKPELSDFGYCDGGCWHPYIQIKAKLIECPGEVKPESEIYWHLAQGLGFSAEEIDTHLPAPTNEAIEEWLKRRLEPFTELTLDRLREGPVLAPGHQEIVWQDYRWPTPSGKIELYSDEAQARWGADPLPRYREPDEHPVAGGDAPYPLQLLTPNTKNRIHSQFGNLQSIRHLDPETLVEISPVDAAARGIGDGNRVEVFNDRGRIELRAFFDHSLRPGCISISNGWWLCEGGGVNLLSSARETDMAHGAAFHDNAVEIRAIR